MTTKRGVTTSATVAAAQVPPIPRWLRLVLICDRAGSAWYIGAGFFFAPVLAVVSPWPLLTTVAWAAIGLAGLWLALLGVAMATGLAIVLRSNAETPEDHWRSIIDYPPATGAAPGSPTARCSRPASV